MAYGWYLYWIKRLGVIAVLAAVVWLAMALFFPTPVQVPEAPMTQRAGTQPATVPATRAGAHDGEEPSRWEAMLSGERGFGSGELLLLEPDHEALEVEPLGLKGYPGAVHEGRFQRSGEGVREALSFWRAGGATAEQVAAFYRAQAAEMKLKALERAPASAPSERQATSLMFLTDEEAGEADWLMIRLTPVNEGVRVVVWLRYAME
jgi:hypothetical protein